MDLQLCNEAGSACCCVRFKPAKEMFSRGSRSVAQFHLKTSVLRAGVAPASFLPPPSPPTVGKCVSRTECPHGLTGSGAGVTRRSANGEEAGRWPGQWESGSEGGGGVLVLLEGVW